MSNLASSPHRRLPQHALLAVLAASMACGSDSSAPADGAPPAADARTAPDAAPIDARAPFAVVATVPGDGDDAIPVDATVRIELSRPVDAATLSMQATWAPCDTTATVQLSADNFMTCVGGTASLTEPTLLDLAPHGSVLGELTTYKLRISAAVTDVDGDPLGGDFVHTTGFTTTRPACTAVVDPAAADATGAACVAPVLRDNGDGTVTDTANKLLWTRCSVDGTGALANGDDFGCVDPAIPDDAVSWERAVAMCDQLEHAGRTDWVLPDVARLRTLVVPDADPGIDSTMFPHSSNLWYNAATSHPETGSSWLVMFGYGGYYGVGHSGKLRFGGALVRCVAGAREPRAPVLNQIRFAWGYPDRLAIAVPSYVTATVPAPSKHAYIGVDGVIAVDGTTVTGAVEGPIDLVALGAYNYEFGGLSGATTYRIVVVAENELGSSVSELVNSTGPIAPLLGGLEYGYSADGIVLYRPGFIVAGSPAPTVHAYLGVDGTIGITGTTVTNALRGPVDVSSIEHDFAGLPVNQNYRIIVVAQNTAGYSQRQVAVSFGYFDDNRDGTVYDPHTSLTWRKCSAGQTWSGATTNNCTGTATRVFFCYEQDNGCNGGTSTGLLGPPWLDPPGASGPYSSGISTVWDNCNESFAGRSDWRVPTKEELRGVDFDEVTFPNPPPGLFWSANSTTPTAAATDESDMTSKTDEAYVRCVAPGH